jgi:hypothetical protein
MTTHRLKTKLTETGKLNLDNLPFKQGDEIIIVITENNYNPSFKNDWSQDFLNFQGISESINFESYRNELLQPKENIFE